MYVCMYVCMYVVRKSAGRDCSEAREGWSSVSDVEKKAIPE